MELQPAAAHCYRVPLTAGALVEWKVESANKYVRLNLYGPDGQEEAPAINGLFEDRWRIQRKRVPATGDYQIIVSSWDGSAAHYDLNKTMHMNDAARDSLDRDWKEFLKTMPCRCSIMTGRPWWIGRRAKP